MTINSKQKGKRGELMWRDQLREHGFCKSYRSQQYCGANDSADVICPELPNIHFEVKNTEKFNLWDAMMQAINDAATKLPVVAYKRNNHEWLVTMRASDWLSLIKETEQVEMIFCPACKQSNVHKHGVTDKLKQRYLCVNSECNTTFVDT